MKAAGTPQKDVTLRTSRDSTGTCCEYAGMKKHLVVNRCLGRHDRQICSGLEEKVLIFCMLKFLDIILSQGVESMA